MTWAQVNSGNNGTTQSLKITGSSGVSDVIVGQRIESFDAGQLAGKTVTLQIAVYNGTGASITPTLATRYAGSTDTWTSPVADLTATNLQPCANGAWTIVAYTFTANAGAVNGYEVKIDFGNNFSSNSKYVQVAAAELRVTPGISAGLNASPPVPELPNVVMELARNARYYQTTFDNAVAPGTATRAGMVGGLIIAAGLNLTFSVPLITPMRTSPTVLTWDGAGTANKSSYYSSGTWTDGNVQALVVQTSTKSLVIASSAGAVMFHFSAYADFW